MMKKSGADFLGLKGHQPISMLTAYTTPVAKCLEKAGIDVILVGDSVGMVEMGFSSTQQVTMQHMTYHIGAVRRGAPNTHIIGDLPYKSTETPQMAVENAKSLIAAGADSVKLEGAEIDNIKAITQAGIMVVGHTGLTPQTASNFKQVGNSQQQVEQLKEEIVAIEQAGAQMIVIEHTQAALATELTKMVKVPTIGIGAGNQCDGQVLVINDACGMGDYWPPFSKQYAHLSQQIESVAQQFKQEVADRAFPDKN